MKSENFTATILVNATAKQVFDAVNNARGWWSENIEGDTHKLHGEFFYHYQDVHRASLKVTEFVPNKKVVWHVFDNYFKYIEDEKEWKGTNVIFEISEQDGQTQLKFTHQGLVPENECFNVCNDAWTYYVKTSLKSLITQGKGDPTAKEISDDSFETKLLQKHIAMKQPETKSIYHRLLIKAPATKIYEAITTQHGLAAWWTPDTIAQPEVGSTLRFTFGNYFKEMKVEELKPASLVKWLCLKGFSDWIGTSLTFELLPHEKGTVLLFHHDGWADYTQEFASCSFDWALFFRSLKFLCETGKGFPYPEFNR